MIKSPLFKGLEPHEIEKIKTKVFKYRKNEYIFNQMESPNYIYILVKGAVQIEKIDGAGKRTIVNVFKNPGTVFGEVYLYIDKPYDYGCLVLKDAEVLAIEKAFFIGENKSGLEEKITNNMISILSHKAFYLNQKLIMVGGMSLRQKLASFLIYSSDGEDIDLDLSREDLADFIGSTRPSVSRELMRMAEDGLIRVDRSKIEILDRENLEDLI